MKEIKYNTYKEIVAEEGFVLASNLEDISKYTSFKKGVFPLNYEATYKEISLEEDKEYKAKQNKYYEELSKRTDSSES